MISAKISALIGKAGDIVIYEIEKGAIRKFADAVGDTNLLYWDDDHARNSRYGSIIAPPGFFGWPVKFSGGMPLAVSIQQELTEALAKEGFPRILDGGVEYEFFRPVRVGDILSSLPRIAAVAEKESKSGAMVVASIDTTFTNQNGDLVARVRKTFIAR